MGGYYMHLVFQMQDLKGDCGFDPKENFTNSEKYAEGWQSRVRELQGGLIVASVIQIVIGLSGLFSVLVQFIGPLTLAPAIITGSFKYFEIYANR